MLLAIGTMSARAQVGRFPMFAPIAGATGRCQSSAAQAAVAGEAANRTMHLHLDGEPERDLMVATNARGGVARFTTTISVKAGVSRREAEYVSAQFDPNGKLLHGERMYMTVGTPATVTEDRRRALTTDEADAALQLAKKLIQRCAR